MRANKRKPPVVRYAPNLNGKWTKPKEDGYLTLITKHYENDGSITVESWYFSANKIHSFKFMENGWLLIHKHEVTPGRDQFSYYPPNEIIRVDFNPPSMTYYNAMTKWVMQEFGITLDEYLEQEQKSDAIVKKENIKRFISKEFDLPIQFLGDEEDDI